MVRKFNNSKYYFYGDGKFENCASEIIPSVRYYRKFKSKVYSYLYPDHLCFSYVRSYLDHLAMSRYSGPGGPFIAS